MRLSMRLRYDKVNMYDKYLEGNIYWNFNGLDMGVNESVM